MKVIYMGTPLFAGPSLQSIHESKHRVLAVVTGEDKPAGRGRKPQPPPVKRLALELGYPVLQPAGLKDESFLNQLRSLEADLFVVVAFRILPDILLRIPRMGAVNLHPSLLPRYRGAAPMQHCLLNGDTVTGVTTIALSAKIDAGDILLQREYPIEPEDDYGSLSERLALAGAELLAETLDGLEAGTITPRAQGLPEAGPGARAPKITPEDQRIHWDRPARDIANQTRAFAPKPGAYTFINGKRLKLFKTAPVQGQGAPGTITKLSPEQMEVGTGDGLLAVAEVQLEGRRRMTVYEFLRGMTLEEGTILG